MTARPEVVSLLLGLDFDASDLPGRRYVHADGRPLTAGETALAASATREELAEARQAAEIYEEYHASMAADFKRVNEILEPCWATLPPEAPFAEALALLPGPERAEAEILLDQLAPDGMLRFPA
jgi:hypothetical protein